MKVSRMEQIRSLKMTDLPIWLIALIAAVVLVVLAVVMQSFYPVGIDWQKIYMVAVRNWSDPYTDSLFVNPPWALLLLPHALLPASLGSVINFLLYVVTLIAVVRRFDGNWLTILLVLTSPFFLLSIRVNNIDWMVLLAFFVPPSWGLLFLALKPQNFGCVALVWWKEKNYSLKMLIPLVAAFALSLLIYGLWMTRTSGLPDDAYKWNLAPFPVGVPLGLWLLYRAYRESDVVIAALATPFLTPYVAMYSIPSLMAIAGGRYKRETIVVYVATFVYFIYESRQLPLITG